MDLPSRRHGYSRSRCCLLLPTNRHSCSVYTMVEPRGDPLPRALHVHQARWRLPGRNNRPLEGYQNGAYKLESLRSGLLPLVPVCSFLWYDQKALFELCDLTNWLQVPSSPCQALPKRWDSATQTLSSLQLLLTSLLQFLQLFSPRSLTDSSGVCHSSPSPW